MRVEFLDLKSQYLSIKPEIDQAIQEVLMSSAFSAGPFVKSFEETFARRHQAKYCVGVNSGTAALHIVFMAIGLGPGDEVIVPANTFFATPESVSLTGATPVFVDCGPLFYNIDVTKIEKCITKSTKAIIAVHLYGQPADLKALKAMADAKGILLIEDCAQAVISEFENKPVGTFGLAGCFSFYPGKNLGAYGEGGAVITNDEQLYRKLMVLRDHGSSKKYYHDLIGHNYRLEGFQGAILNVKMKYINAWTDTRRKNAALYNELLKDCPDVILPREMPGLKHVYHLFVVRVKERDGIIEHLKKNEIFTGIHYPIPCHLQKAYSFLKYSKGDLPVSEQLAGEILSLPMSAELTGPQIEYVCDKIKSYYRKG